MHEAFEPWSFGEGRCQAVNVDSKVRALVKVAKSPSEADRDTISRGSTPVRCKPATVSFNGAFRSLKTSRSRAGYFARGTPKTTWPRACMAALVRKKTTSGPPQSSPLGRPRAANYTAAASDNNVDARSSPSPWQSLAVVDVDEAERQRGKPSPPVPSGAPIMLVPETVAVAAASDAVARGASSQSPSPWPRARSTAPGSASADGAHGSVQWAILAEQASQRCRSTSSRWTPQREANGAEVLRLTERGRSRSVNGGSVGGWCQFADVTPSGTRSETMPVPPPRSSSRRSDGGSVAGQGGAGDDRERWFSFFKSRQAEASGALTQALAIRRAQAGGGPATPAPPIPSPHLSLELLMNATQVARQRPKMDNRGRFGRPPPEVHSDGPIFRTLGEKGPLKNPGGTDEGFRFDDMAYCQPPMVVDEILAEAPTGGYHQWAPQWTLRS